MPSISIIYALIIIIIGGNDGGSSINRVAEFRTQEQCLLAAHEVTSIRHTSWESYVHAYCLKDVVRR